MSRYALQFAYDGGSFHGYQIQPNAHTVQAELEHHLRLMLGVPTEIVGSSRTDTGVHARQQMAHFDAEALASSDWVYRLNRMVSHSISVQAIYAVADDFHARFDATYRRYEYHISTRKDPLLRDFAYWFQADVDVEAMNAAAAILCTHTDFQSFSKVKTEVTNFDCTITEAFWEYRGNTLVFTIQGNRFLRGMVRSLVGTLLEIGVGKWTAADLRRILASQDRQMAGRAVPAHGLHLMEVAYPPTLLGAKFA